MKEAIMTNEDNYGDPTQITANASAGFNVFTDGVGADELNIQDDSWQEGDNGTKANARDSPNDDANMTSPEIDRCHVNDTLNSIVNQESDATQPFLPSEHDVPKDADCDISTSSPAAPETVAENRNCTNNDDCPVANSKKRSHKRYRVATNGNDDSIAVKRKKPSQKLKGRSFSVLQKIDFVLEGKETSIPAVAKKYNLDRRQLISWHENFDLLWEESQVTTGRANTHQSDSDVSNNDSELPSSKYDYVPFTAKEKINILLEAKANNNFEATAKKYKINCNQLRIWRKQLSHLRKRLESLLFIVSGILTMVITQTRMDSIASTIYLPIVLRKTKMRSNRILMQTSKVLKIFSRNMRMKMMIVKTKVIAAATIVNVVTIVWNQQMTSKRAF
jgi:hypothetical protein